MSWSLKVVSDCDFIPFSLTRQLIHIITQTLPFSIGPETVIIFIQIYFPQIFLRKIDCLISS